MTEKTNPTRRFGKGWGYAVASIAVGLGLAWNGTAHAGYASMIVDGTTGEILNQVNPDMVNHPASLTKLMTMYLAFQSMKQGRMNMGSQLQVSAWAAGKSPTKLNLQAGTTVSMHDCILGMITKSANDAATVVAENIGGSEDSFAEMMNAQARRLGMTNTHFANASGLPASYQVTTARDLVKLSMAIYRDFPQYFPLFATREFVFEGHEIHGHNNLMYRYAGMDGLKTGFTNASGFNLASTAVRGGHRLFGVVMGSTSAGVRDRLMETLLDNGFEHKPTDPVLVAEAGGVRAGEAGRVLASLSPVGTAEAATLPRHATKAQRIAAARQARVHAHAVQLASAKPHRGHVEAASYRTNWTVQVGAYRNKAQAEHAASGAVHVAHGHAAIAKSGHVYRAQLTGFSQAQAQAACRKLHASGQSCSVVSPKGGVKLASE